MKLFKKFATRKSIASKIIISCAIIVTISAIIYKCIEPSENREWIYMLLISSGLIIISQLININKIKNK